jgi:hypothetical protein
MPAMPDVVVVFTEPEARALNGLLEGLDTNSMEARAFDKLKKSLEYVHAAKKTGSGRRMFRGEKP